MATPKRGRDISQEWLEIILSQYEARANPGASVQVTSFQVSPGTKPGENFASEVVKMMVEGRVCGGHRSQDPVTTTYNLFAKFHIGSAFEQEVGKLTHAHVRELLIYSDIISELNDFQARMGGDKYRINIPEFVYGISTENDYVLVMKDISPKGYVTEDKRAGLDLPHLLMAADRLAKLHAVSYAFCTKHNFILKYPAFVEDYDLTGVFYRGTTKIVYDGVIEAAEKKKEIYDCILTKMKNNKEAVIQNFASCLGSAPLTCLAHGDAWTNNFMYINKEDERGELQPEEMMLIDWGITILRNPLLDLQYLIHTSTTLSLRKSHLEEILRHYHSTFIAATTDMGASVDNWEFDDFMAEWRRTRIFGVLMGILTCMFALCEASKDLNKKDTSSPSAFSTWLGSFMGKTFGPVLLYMFSSPSFEFVSRWSFSSFLKGMLAELISWENDTLQNRVFDLLTEADENGLLDA